MAVEWILTGGEFVAQGSIPMPPSIRNTSAKAQRAWFRDQVLACMSGTELDEAEYAVRLIYHGTWYNMNGSIKRRDLPNLLSHLSDDVAEALKVDDKCWFHIALSKAHESLDDERVDVTVWRVS